MVSDIYPTPTTAIADVILPAAMWVEREGVLRQQRAAHPAVGTSWCEPPGGEPARLLADRSRWPGGWGIGELFPWKTEEEQARGLFEEYRQFTLGVGKDLATYDELKAARGLRWPVIDGRETRWRYRGGLRPVRQEGRRASRSTATRRWRTGR